MLNYRGRVPPAAGCHARCRPGQRAVNPHACGALARIEQWLIERFHVCLTPPFRPPCAVF